MLAIVIPSHPDPLRPGGAALIPDPSRLLEAAGIRTPLIGFYDAPSPEPFAPLVAAGSGAERCVFSRYRDWCAGRTLHLTKEKFGCGGAGRAFCGVESMEREDFVQFLAVTEGLKDSPELMQAWIDAKPLRATRRRSSPPSERAACS
jgi:hypothetical protein